MAAPRRTKRKRSAFVDPTDPVFETEAYFRAAAMALADEGDEIEVHDTDCSHVTSDGRRRCDCEPLTIEVGEKASA